MRFRTIFLQTLFLQTLREFYSSVLHLPVNELRGRLEIQIGTTKLVFTEAAGQEPFYHFAINIPSNRIEDAKAWLKNRVSLMWMDDYNSDIADFASWKAKSVYFFDPAGNIVELIARFDLNNGSDYSFSSDDFLSVSEIGIVFDDKLFDEQVGDLMNSYSLSYFSKQPPLPKFRAIGDDEGLLIAVPAQRNWYPTQKGAAMFPMSIECEIANRHHNLVF